MEQEEKCLALSLVRVHGTDVYALLDSGATPNVISLSFAERLELSPTKTNRVVTVATEENSLAEGRLGRILVSL